MKIKSGILLAGTALLLPLLGSWQSPDAEPAPAPKTVTVKMQEMKFIPETLEINKGDTVEWINLEIVPHTSTSQGNWDSGMIGDGAKWKHTFTKSGEFPYTCTYHPTMTGKLIVK